MDSPTKRGQEPSGRGGDRSCVHRQIHEPSWCFLQPASTPHFAAAQSFAPAAAFVSKAKQNAVKMRRLQQLAGECFFPSPFARELVKLFFSFKSRQREWRNKLERRNIYLSSRGAVPLS